MESGDFIEVFGSYVDQHAATVFVGAGLSTSVGYPDWKTLTELFLAELNLGSMDDLPQLAQYYEDNAAGGRARLEAHIDAELAKIDPKPGYVHRLLDQLPIEEFWTTNYDPLLEMSLSDNHPYYVDGDLAGAIPPSRRKIYKMHGTQSAPDAQPNFVITRGDYERYPMSHPRFWMLLRVSS